MNRVLMELLPPQERLRSIRDRLAAGGTWEEMALVFLSLAAFAVFLYLLFRIQRRHRRLETYDPRKLFRSLIVRLGLTVRQRDLLTRLAADRRLEHPTVLLLAPNLFWFYADRWLERSRRRRPQLRQELEKLATVLFTDSRTEGGSMTHHS